MTIYRAPTKAQTLKVSMFSNDDGGVEVTNKNAVPVIDTYNLFTRINHFVLSVKRPSKTALLSAKRICLRLLFCRFEEDFS